MPPKTPKNKPKPKTMRDPKRLHAVFKGRVQGVGFRYLVETLATQRGAVGWVRNLPKGDVEMLAEGDAAALEALLTDIRSSRLGTHLKKCAAKWLPYEGSFSEFQIEYVYG